MPHPDSIKVVVEDAANISVAAAESLGSVDVSPETPAVISINTNSAQITLAELVGGTPLDGQVIVYDTTTNTFIYDYSTGSGGSLSSSLVSTNKDSAVGDAVARVYQENDSHESIIRDILSPEGPVIRSAKINYSKVSSGFNVPANTISRIDSIVFEFMFPDRLSSTFPIQVKIGNDVIATSTSFPSDYGFTRKTTVSFSGSGIPARSHGTISPLRISSSHQVASGTNDFHFEENIYHGRAAFISSHPDFEGTPSNPISFLVSRIDGFGVPDSDESNGQHLVLNGSDRTEDSENYTWLAIPTEFDLVSIGEIVAEEGVANRTFSFTRVGDEHTYALANGSYSVYLYRSNQKGALSQNSSLSIKLNRS